MAQHFLVCYAVQSDVETDRGKRKKVFKVNNGITFGRKPVLEG